MKKLAGILTMCLFVWLGHAQVTRTVQSNAGILRFLLEPDIDSIINLTITGEMNAVDFRVIRDELPALKNLDLSGVIISEYVGNDGTVTNPMTSLHFPANQIPSGSFLEKTNFETLILPDSALTMGSKVFYLFQAKNPINIPRKLQPVKLGFFQCKTPVTVHPENEFLSALDGVLFNKQQTELLFVPISRTGEYTIPSTVNILNVSAFNGCDKLSTVNIPSSVNTIMSAVFNNCSAQFNVDENNTAFSGIDGVLFNKLKSTIIQVPMSRSGHYTIPSTVTSIGSAAFTNCKGLTSVSIPHSIQSINNSAFSGCSNLSLIRILTNTPPAISSGVFQTVNTDSCILIVPGGTSNAYKTAAVWKNFKNIVEPVTTQAATSVTFTSAVLNGEIIHVDSTQLTTYGFCWNTTGLPTIADHTIYKGTLTSPKIFNDSITGLSEGTKYYIRAFAIDSLGTTYGQEVSFTTQSIPDDAGLITGISTVCQGQNNVIYSVPTIKNATSYSWTLPEGATGTSTTNSISVNYDKNAVSGQLSVKGKNEWHEGKVSTLAISINPLPANPGTISGYSSVCLGDSAIEYTVNPVEHATSYNWTLPTGATGTSTTNTIRVTYTRNAISGNITVKGSNDCGDGVVSTLPVTVHQLPLVSVTDKTALCGESVILANPGDFSGGEALKFKWTPSTGLNNDTLPNPVAYVTSNISYTVRVTNSNGCSSYAVVRINLKPMDKPQIGIVGVNSSNKNIIVWNKPASTGIESFEIYKETTVSDVYEKIGTVPYSNLSVFTDSLSNPTVKSGKYKLSIIDKSGLETQLSDPHKTMHLTINKGQNNTWNLIWEPYTGFSPATYNIYRGNSASSLGFLDATSGSSTQFSDISAPTGDIYYQVEVISPVLVNPSRIPSSTESGTQATASYNSSRSNIARNIVSGIPDFATESVNIHVYPNPAINQFTIEAEGGADFEILNLTGQLIYKGNLNNSNTVQTGNFSSGVYLIKVNTGKIIEFKKVIIE